MNRTQLQSTWNEAIVAEPIGTVDQSLNTTGIITLLANTFTILSTNPSEDFELNTDIIHNWKIVFQNSDDEVIGDADYFQALKALQPYTLDQQSGSLLIDKLGDEKLNKIFATVRRTESEIPLS